MWGGAVLIKFPTEIGTGILLLTLETDGGLPKNELAQNLSNIYPFIDNDLVINNLVQVINTKFNDQPVKEGEKIVRLHESETRDILSAAGLSEEQTQQIVRDLK